MPEMAIEALSTIGEVGGEIAAGAGELGGAALGAGEGALSGLFAAGEPLAAGGLEAGSGLVESALSGAGDVFGSAETGLSSLFGGGGVPAGGELGSFGGDVFGAGAAPGADISSATFIMPDGSVLPGPNVEGVTDLGSLTGGGGPGGGATDLSGLMDAGSPAHAGGGFGAGAAGGTAGDVAGLAGGKAAEGGGLFGNIGSSLLGSVTKNPLGIAAAAGGLGYNLWKGQQQTENQKALSGIAGQEFAQGQQLQQYLQNGTLPPGMQAQLDNSKAAAKAQIISGYAARGQPADPSMNSALAQELAAVDTNALELQGKIATNLLTAGINETNMSANLFQALIQMDTAQAKSMGAAIANFSTALAGGPKVFAIGGGATA